MASESDSSSPPWTLTTSGESSPDSPTRPRSFFRNRFSNASLLSLSSVRTLLPQYSATDALEDPATIASGHTTRPPSWTGPLEPPCYSLINEGEFQYAYPIRAKKPWATLRLHTRDAVPGDFKRLQTQPKVPRFWGCDSIKGTLELDLDTSQNIQRISISLNGNVVMSSLSEESLRFLGREYTLWDKLMSNSLESDPNENNSQKKKVDGRFDPGQYTFPFSFPFPAEADPIKTHSALSTLPTPFLQEDILKTAGKKKRTSQSFITSTSSGVSPWGMEETASTSSDIQVSSRQSQTPHSCASSKLPQSSMDKGMNHHVAYEISVRIDHGRFKANSKIKTTIAYIPATQPPPGSQKRREAYEADALLPCPMDDPGGWFALPTLTMYGFATLHEKPRHTKVECTLYLAEPLSYTRGSVIPCFLTISGKDERLIELLSNPRTPSLRLLRRIQHPKGEDDKVASDPISGIGVFLGGMSPGISAPVTGKMKLVSHEVGHAQWWSPSKSVIQSSTVTIRHLEGEIHLSPTLQSSCDFQFFQVQYAVELTSFRTDKFEPDIRPSSRRNSRKTDTVLTSRVVEITTLYREDEPMPTAYSEPPKIPIMRQINLDDDRATIFEDDE